MILTFLDSWVILQVTKQYETNSRNKIKRRMEHEEARSGASYGGSGRGDGNHRL